VKKALLLLTLSIITLTLLECVSSESDQAIEHYQTLTPIIEGATSALNDMYALDEKLANQTVTLDYAGQQTNQLRSEYVFFQSQIQAVKPPKDFKDEFQLLKNWMDQGLKCFDIMLETIDKEENNAPDLQKSLDDFYSAWDLETQLYDQMTQAYTQQMNEKGVELY